MNSPDRILEELAQRYVQLSENEQLLILSILAVGLLLFLMLLLSIIRSLFRPRRRSPPVEQDTSVNWSTGVYSDRKLSSDMELIKGELKYLKLELTSVHEVVDSIEKRMGAVQSEDNLPPPKRGRGRPLDDF